MRSKPGGSPDSCSRCGRKLGIEIAYMLRERQAFRRVFLYCGTCERRVQLPEASEPADS